MPRCINCGYLGFKREMIECRECDRWVCWSGGECDGVHDNGCGQ